jgi:hypothetical protein
LTITKIEANLETIEYLVAKDCPYCHGAFRIDATGEHDSVSPVTRIVDTYLCVECGEVFEIHRENHENVSFLISCNGIYVRCFDDQFAVTTDNRLLYRKLGLTAPHALLPAFPLILADKDKLYQKLRTYLIFS